MEEYGRLLTKEAEDISRGGELPKRSRKRPRGLVVESAEGFRWAYSALRLPGQALLETIPVEQEAGLTTPLTEAAAKEE